jgi:predicted phosphodiesterase
MKLIAFSDIHGSVTALEKAIQYIQHQETVDAIIIAGDFASINYDHTDVKILEEDRKISRMFSLLEDLPIPYYFVWGNRDAFHFMFMMTIQSEDAASRHIDELSNGTFLTDTAVIPLDAFHITSNPQRVDKNTLFVTHWQERIEGNSLLHLEGHVHYGQYHANYVNLGFLFRDSLHGAEQLLGGIWEIELANHQIERIEYVDFGDNINRLLCPHHPEEGTFYIPTYWRNCPVCFDDDNAKFRKRR